MKLLVLKQKLLNLTKDKRSYEIQKNIVLSFLFKGISIIVSLVIVPLTLNYLNPTEYGVWLTLSSIMTWINLFDIGLGNGLRNKLTEALTLGDIKKGQNLVSTTFALLTIIIGLFFVLYVIVSPFLDWSRILNTTIESSDKLNQIVLVVLVFFCFQFVFKTVGTVFISDQKPAANDFMGAISSILSLLTISLLTKFTQGSLLYVAIVFSALPSLVFFVTYLIVFNSKYKPLKPCYKTIDWGNTKGLMNLGVQFFILQIGGIVLYFTSNIIVAQVFSPYEVTVYNIAYKYSNIISMVCLIIITPLWSAATEAFHLKDWQWFKSVEKKMLRLYIVITIGSVLLIMLSNWFYQLWIGTSIQIPFTLTVTMIIYNLLFVLSSIYIYMLNGIGKIRLQLWSSVIEIAITVPLCVILAKQIGIEGVAIGMIIMISFRTIWAPIQFKKIITEKAIGIWNK